MTRRIKNGRIGLYTSVGVALLLCLLALCLIFVPILRDEENNEYRDMLLSELEERVGEYDSGVIVLQNTNKASADALAARLGATVRITGDGSFATLTLPEGVTILDVCKNDEYLDVITKLTPDYKVKLSDVENSVSRIPEAPYYTVTDASFTLETYIDYLNMQNTWSVTRGEGVTVAVIDTGIDTDHPEFAGRISEYSYYASGDKIVKDNVLEGGGYDWSLIEDENGHGTAVAGVIAASMNEGQTIGIAPEVTLLVIKADVDEYGNFKNSSDLVFGLYYAIERDANVVNMSFGMEVNDEKLDIFRAPAKLAYDSDVICVASAGNDATAALTSPAYLPYVFGVGSLADGSFSIADYSNYGENIDIVAPGSTYTTYLDGGYKTMDGTSFSSPLVSGAIALFCSQNKYTEFKVVEELLYASSTDLGDLGPDFIYGYGALDIGSFIVGERGKVTFDMMTDELEDLSATFIEDIPLQVIPVPERLYAVFDGWYYDIYCTEEYVWYEDAFADDLTLYANWVNEEDGIPYIYVELDDGTIEIRQYTGHRRYITIPTYIDGKVVSSIGEGAFMGNTNVRSVTLPDGLVRIRKNAFFGCSNLVSVDFPDSLKYIEDSAFYGSARLSSVNFSARSELLSVGEYAFADCPRIRTVFIPRGVTSFAENALLYSTNLKDIDVDSANEYYTDIDGVLLNKAETELLIYPYGRSGEYTVPMSVEVIKTYAFRRARVGIIDFSLTKTIEAFAFSESKIFEVVFPDTLTSLGESAFSECTYLSKITFGAGLSAVPAGAFYNCSSLYAVDLPFAIESVGSGAFSRCMSLTLLSFTPSLTSIGDFAFSYCSSLDELTFPEDSRLEVIGANAFEMTSIEAVDFPKSLKTIAPKAFYGVALTHVGFAMDGCLELIGDSAFESAPISTLLLPNSLVSLGASAFSGGLFDSVEIPRNVKALSNAFAGCRNLTEVIVVPENPYYNSILGRVYSEDGTTFVIYPSGNTDSDYAVLDGVKRIGSESFAKTYHLINASVPEGNEVIGSFAFSSSSVVDVRIGQGLKTIEQCAFIFAEKLETINLPEGLTLVEKEAFYGTDSLIHLDIPSTITVLTENSFSGCGARSYSLPDTLTEIQTEALSDNKNLSRLDIPDNVAKICSNAFLGSYSLAKINISESTKMVRVDYGAFAYCGLKSFRMPSVISSMAQGAFEGCRYLESFTFAAGSKIETITAYMFFGCTNLKSVVFEEGAHVTSIQAHGFEGMDTLVSVDFGDAKITNIDNFAFRFCSSLTTLELPQSMLSIGRYAFYGCKSFEKLSIPKGVEFIGRFAFLGTTDCEIYFESPTLPEYLAEDWDHGIRGYYLGVLDIVETEEFKYAKLTDGKIGIIEYLGDKTVIDLTEYDFGGEVVNIGGSAFAFSKIESIVLPNTLVTISAGAFDSSALTGITIPASVTAIGRDAFYGTPLASLVFEDNSSLVNIEQSAFENTKKLKSVTLPASVEVLGRAVFKNSGIESLEFAEGSVLTEISREAFEFTPITSLTLPRGITLIDHNAFSNTKSLSSVTFGEADVTVMSNAFYKSGLNELHIPKNVVYIGEYAFVSLSNLAEFTVAEDNPYYASLSGLLVTKDCRKLISVPAGMTGTLDLPVSIEVIGFGAFESSALNSVNFSSEANILSLGYRAFFGASNIEEITIPASVVAIDYYAFANCSSLKRVTFAEGSSLRGIYEGAFLGCRKLTDISLADEIIEISDYAFYGCSSLDRIPISEGSSLKGIYSYAFAYSGISGDFTTPANLYDIGDYAFLGTRITKLTVPSEGAYDLFIGIGAFEGTNQLKEVTLPFIGNAMDGEYGWFAYVFGAGAPEAGSVYVPKSLEKVTFTDGTEIIANSAFYRLEGLKEVQLPSTVNTLYPNAFYGTNFKYSFDNPILTVETSRNGTEVYEINRFHFTENLIGDLVIAEGVSAIGSNSFIGGGSDKNISISSLILPDSISKIETSAFVNCSFIGDFTIPKNIISLSPASFQNTPVSSYVIREELAHLVEENGVFYTRDMKNIAFISPNYVGEYVMPMSVVSISPGQFSGLKGLTRVTLNSNITEIPESAFADCTALSEVVFEGEVVSLGQYAFSGCSQLEFFDIPKGITVIPMYAFSKCGKLKNVVIPEGVVKIETCAFYGNLSHFSHVQSDSRYWTMESITLPSTLTEIADDAFDFNRITVIYNNSSLELTLDSKENGSIAYSTSKIVNADGEVILKDGYVEPTPKPEKELYYDENGFVFEQINGFYKLIDYVGRESSVILPLDFNGQQYTMSSLELTGVSEVIFPEGMTSVPSRAFDGNRSLFSVVLPESVKQIGADAFRFCLSLRHVDFGGVTTIGEGAFKYSGLLCADLPEGVFTVSDSAFCGCESLVRVNLPSTLKSIENMAFSWCEILSSVSLPSGLEKLSETAFYQCTELDYFYLPDTFGNDLTSLANINVDAICISSTNPYFVIENGVLYSKDMSIIYAISSSFDSFTVPNHVSEIQCQLRVREVLFEEGTQFTVIPKGIFDNNSTVERVILPEGVTEIDDGAFMGGSGNRLSYVHLPDSLVSIGHNAFYGCEKLTTITFGKNVKSIGQNAFNYAAVSEFKVDSRNRYLSTNGALLMNNSGTEVIMHAPALKSFVIPSTVTKLPENLFYSHWGYDSIIFESVSMLREIDSRFFSSSVHVSILELPEGLEVLKARALYGINIDTLILPSTLNEIEVKNYYTGPDSISKLYNNSSLDILSIWEEAIGEESLVYDKNGELIHGSFGDILVTDDGFIYVEDASGYCIVGTILNDDVITLPDSINGESYTCKWLSLNKTIRLPDSMVDVPMDFLMKSRIKEVIIPATVKTIGSNAFWYSTVERVTFEEGSNLTEIIETAFRESSIREIILPKSVTKIGFWAFYQCKNLTRVEFKSINLTFDDSCFEGCTALEEVVFNPEATVEISKSLFRNCTALYRVSLAENTAKIGSSAFYGCTSLTDITLPEGLLNIGGFAFYDCASLKEINIPSSVISIGNAVFEGTDVYNNPDNWSGGILIIDNHCIRIDVNATYAIIPDTVFTCASDYLDNCYKLKVLQVSSDKLIVGDYLAPLADLTNLETLILTSMPESYIASLFDYRFGKYGRIESATLPLTFKKLVLPQNASLSHKLNGGAFAGLSNISIFVNDIEKNLRWDENFEGWSNGNRVYYSDKWIKTVFHGIDGELLSIEIFNTSQVLRLPWADDFISGSYRYLYQGFDINGDGNPDSIPATSTVNINARVIYKSELVCLRDGHTIINVSQKDATCTENGHTAYVFCKWCEYIVGYTEFEAFGHSIIHSTAKAPTCEEWGYTEHDYCERCDYETVHTNFEPLGHSYTATITPPTCILEGYTTHTCTTCFDTYTDSVVAANGHSYSSRIVGATCTEAGYTEYSCKCGDIYRGNYVEAAGHSYYVEQFAPTCTEQGYELYYCYKCGDSYRDNYVPANEHTYMHIIVKATCTEDGYIKYHCEWCGYNYIAETIKAQGHVYETKTSKPTCTDDGYTLYECMVCGYICKDDYVSATGHSYTAEIIMPTCTENGGTLYTCHCGDSYLTDEVAAIGHDIVTVAAKEPTCTENGYNEHEYCTRCSYSTKEEIRLLGHSYVWVEEMQPTCTQSGYSSYKYCQRCEEKIGFVEKQPLGHNIINHLGKAPTCTEWGYSSYEDCSRCEDYSTYQAIEPTGHSYNATTVAPTCTENGYTLYTCLCGYSYTDAPVDALGHDIVRYDGKEPGCTEFGWQPYEACTRCDYTTYREIKPLGNYVTTVVPPTCTERGYTIYTCTHCNDSFKDHYVDALGHSGEWITEAEATCASLGAKYRVCTTCGHKEEEIIEKLPHSLTSYEAKVPTCTETGYHAYVACNNCAYTTYSELSALGHLTVQHAGLEPTCFVGGWQPYEICQRCNYSTYVALDPHHAYDKETIIIPPTCNEYGYTKHVCECGEYYFDNRVEMTNNHKWELHEVISAADCENIGHEWHKCSVCEMLNYVDVAALGHLEGEWTVTVQPTVTSQGMRIKTCTRCGELIAREVLTLDECAKFIMLVDEVRTSESVDELYRSIKRALEKYALLSEEDKALTEVVTAYSELEGYIVNYNAYAEEMNGEKPKAPVLAIVLLGSTSLTLGAWLTIKKFI